MAEILNPIILNFDPMKLEDRFISKIFDSKISKNIWLAMHNGRDVNSNFSKNCLDLGNYIEAIKVVPDDVCSLHSLIVFFFDESTANAYSTKFKRELLPYLRGDDNLEYVIIR